LIAQATVGTNWVPLRGNYTFWEAGNITSATVFLSTAASTANMYVDSFAITPNSIVNNGSYPQLITDGSCEGTSAWTAYNSSISTATDGGIAGTFNVRGAVQLVRASNIKFIRNKFQHLGAAGINLSDAVNDVEITGNTFDDISDAAVIVGEVYHNSVAPNGGYDVCKNNSITNNLITNTGKDYRASVPIFATYVEGLLVSHNHIDGVPNSGISVGWGWSYVQGSTTSKNNTISYNKVLNTANKNKDCGGIYTLGEMPNSTVTRNYVKNTNNSFGALYTDEGSAYISLTYNVIENTNKWLHIWTSTIHDINADNNWSNNTNIQNSGTNCSVTNTKYETNSPPWSSGAQSVINEAGLQADYWDLLGNLISNSGFETGNTNNWLGDSATISTITADKHSGSYSCKASSRQAYWSSARQNVSLNNNKTYDASAWVKLGSGSDTAFLYAKIVAGGVEYHRTFASGTVNSSGWTQLSGQYTFSESGPITSAQIFVCTNSSTVDMYTDDFTLSQR
jgi:hypothetical protein